MGKKRIELEAEILMKKNQRKVKFINYLLIFFLALFFFALIFLFREIFVREVLLAPIEVDCSTGIVNLDIDNQIYILTSDVSASQTCFQIRANNVSLDGQGHKILYRLDGSNDRYGVRMMGANFTTIKNLKIEEGGISGKAGFAVYIHGVNNTIVENVFINNFNASSINIVDSSLIIIRNNTINTTDNGISLKNSFFNILENNIIINNIRSNPLESQNIIGISLNENSHFNNIYFNNITTYNFDSSGIKLEGNNNILNGNSIIIFNDSSAAIRIITGTTINNSLINLNLKTFGNNAQGILISAENHQFELRDSKIDTTGIGSFDLQIINSVLGGEWNLTNVSFIDIDWQSTTGILNVHWYADFLSRYNNGTIIQGVNITGKNVFGDLSFSRLTGLDGKIPRQSILSYSKFANNFIDQNNYTFEARLFDGSQNFTQSWNITQNSEIIFIFSSDIKSPLVNIFDPDPITYSALPIPLNITTSESSIAYYSLDAGANNISLIGNDSGTGFTERINSISNGNYTLSYYVKDLAGNMNNTERVNFTVSLNLSDTTPPLVNIYDPDNGAIYGSLPIPVNMGTNENSTASYSLDSGRNNVSMTVNSSLTGFIANISSIANGNYVIGFYVRDLVGNKNYTESRNFSVNLQTSAGDEDDGGVNNGAAPNIAPTNQNSQQQTNQPLSADTLNDDISGLRRVTVSSNVKVINVDNHEKIVLDVGDNKNYGVSFAIVNGNVKLVVSDGEYEIKAGGIIFVDAGKKKVYIGVKEVSQDSAKIAFGLEEANVKKELSGENDAEKRKKVAYILGIVFIILLIFVVALILYYIMSNKDGGDEFSDEQRVRINQNFAVSGDGF